MKIYKIEKAEKPTMVVLPSIVVSIIVLILGILGMSILASLKTPPFEIKNSVRPLRVEALKFAKEDAPIVITAYGEVKALKQDR